MICRTCPFITAVITLTAAIGIRRLQEGRVYAGGFLLGSRPCFYWGNPNDLHQKTTSRLIQLALCYTRCSQAVLIIHVPVKDIDTDLRRMVFATAASFNAATSAEEQTTQRALVGMVITAALERHKWLDAKVRSRIDHLRYGAV